MPVSSARERLVWIDTARGLAILLVVLMHATDWVQETSLRIPLWDAANDVLSTLRMPLLFMCAGILGKKYLSAPWADVASRKVFFLGWLYLAWQPIGSLMALVASHFNGDELTPLRMFVSLVLTPVRPRFELWFIWALAVFFICARGTARTPVSRQFAISGLASAVWFSSLGPQINIGWDGLAKYYVFFLIGCRGRTLLLDFARSMTRLPALALLVGWLLVSVGAYASGLEEVFGVGFAVRVVGLAAGIALATLLQELPLFSYLGSRSLEIYLAHTPFIILLMLLVDNQLQSRWLYYATPALPLLLSVPAIWLSTGLHDLLKTTRAGLLFKPPVALTAAIHARAGARLGFEPLPPPDPQEGAIAIGVIAAQDRPSVLHDRVLTALRGMRRRQKPSAAASPLHETSSE